MLQLIVFLLLNVLFLVSCASYKQRIDRVCKKHGLKELPSPQVSVEFYYGKQKVKDLFELKQKIDSADMATGRKFDLDTIAVDNMGRVVYEAPKPRNVRPMMMIKLEMPKNAFFEDLQKMKRYRGLRIVSSKEHFELFESNGHRIRYLSSFLEGGGVLKSYSRIVIEEYTGDIDALFSLQTLFMKKIIILL